MNKTLELQQRKTALHDQTKQILDKVEAAGRVMTPDERTSVDANFVEMDGIDALIQSRSRLSGKAAIAEHVKDLFLDKPFGYDANPQLWENRLKETKQEKTYRISRGFGEQLQAVRLAAVSPHNVDPRLNELNERSASGMSEAVPADGGFLVYPDFASEVLRYAHETGIVFKSGRKIPISEQTNAIKIPAIDEQSRADGSRWGGVKSYWMNEADSLTATKPKFRLIELVTKKMGALYYATDEVLRDAVALGGIITQAFGEEFGFRMDDAAINGDGAGKPLGILNSPALVSVAKESAQTATTVNFQNVTKMWYRLWARSRANSVWYVNQDVEQQLMQLSLSVGTGGSSVVAGVGAYHGPIAVYTPPGFMGNATGTLFNRPVMPIEQCQTLGTKGDIILADMSQWIYIDKGEPQQAVSMHVKFLTDEQTFRSIYRVDGQPWWQTPLTPFKGSNTVSPYISLDTRS